MRIIPLTLLLMSSLPILAEPVIIGPDGVTPLDL